MVFGAVQRVGKVVTQIVPDTKAVILINAVNTSIKKGSIMVSDENVGYAKLNKNFIHLSVNHSKDEYVRGNAHTNTIEGFWSLLKKQINGIHHSVSPKHLQRYCNEASFRYNSKHIAQDERFANALSNCEGKLTYDTITK